MSAKEIRVQTLKQRSYQFIILFGFVSMFGDITYEGGRSITGPYLALLGVSATMVGFIGGVGEFVGYVFRLVSGYVADKTKAYWAITYLGYGLLISMPLLALTNNWKVAAILIILERFGKAVRSPAKDTMLSHATKSVGTGWGFAIHEAIDQIGGLIGPLIFTAVFFLKSGYKQGLTILWIPAIVTLLFLTLARFKNPRPEELEEQAELESDHTDNKRTLPAIFWWYMAFSFICVTGFANFQMIAYHFKVRSVISDLQIPMFYAIAMAVDAVVALIAGKVYDKIGLKTLIILPVLTLPIPFLAFTNSFQATLISIILWGGVMGIQETIMRAVIADIVPKNKRGFAYGLFNTAYGAALFAGSVLIGFLYDRNISYINWFTTIAEVIAVGVFVGLIRTLRQPKTI
ncbi:MFS transporter [Arcticibacter tournemirensis]|uniref:MFS transporter n=1 Tax=Arcticibacter tournemirensis TaxID=699437 RepID=A0A5M9HKR6_9SPHI|nr:MFS transporter [Arcticibacter tournemirensis]KAA8485587.1 MFS transporter [Arcticibacter tournemirensis]TQM48696.1 MFS transporter [Arcticibacter tournemirensis]